MGESHDVVVVVETADPMELAMARQLLEGANIPCAVANTGSASYVTALMGQQFQGVQLLEVPVEFEDRARKVLEAAWGEPAEEGDEDSSG